MQRESSVTIVLVDDDLGHTELVRRNLKRAGFNNGIVSFTNGSDALDFVFRRGRYAERDGNGNLLVLLDINMPGLNGVEVLRQIKTDPDTRMIPVIMLTTTDDPREINRCYELGCNVYVTKPVQPQEFIEAIRRLGLMISIVTMPTDSSP